MVLYLHEEEYAFLLPSHLIRGFMLAVELER